MSSRGLVKFAQVLTDLQQLRHELLADATDRVDCGLSALCRDMNDAVKDRFAALASAQCGLDARRRRQAKADSIARAKAWKARAAK
ncbi:MAG: hypothetical protein E6Q97_22630 [Desulfurellales bacterium]|nr:MAG: hypothetical protein E6Q97_22630 [Desulfurellales bacterium]